MRFHSYLYAFLFFMTPLLAEAATLEGTLSSMVNAFVGSILPILALGYLGKHIFGYVQGDPQVKQQTPTVVIACACLLGISMVWSWIQGHIK